MLTSLLLANYWPLTLHRICYTKGFNNFLSRRKPLPATRIGSAQVLRRWKRTPCLFATSNTYRPLLFLSSQTVAQ